MRIKLDSDLCQGHGRCHFEANQLFDLGNADGKAVALVDVVPEEQLDAAQRAVQACPERAIRLEE